MKGTPHILLASYQNTFVVSSSHHAVIISHLLGEHIRRNLTRHEGTIYLLEIFSAVTTVLGHCELVQIQNALKHRVSQNCSGYSAWAWHHVYLQEHFGHFGGGSAESADSLSVGNTGTTNNDWLSMWTQISACLQRWLGRPRQSELVSWWTAAVTIAVGWKWSLQGNHSQWGNWTPMWRGMEVGKPALWRKSSVTALGETRDEKSRYEWRKLENLFF